MEVRKFTKSQIFLFQTDGFVIDIGHEETYKHIPYWIKELNNGACEVYKYNELPEDVKEFSPICVLEKRIANLKKELNNKTEEAQSLKAENKELKKLVPSSANLKDRFLLKIISAIIKEWENNY